MAPYGCNKTSQLRARQNDAVLRVHYKMCKNSDTEQNDQFFGIMK